MLDIIKRSLQAYSEGRWDDCKADFAPDAVYEEIATGTRAEGADAFLDAIRRWKQAFPDLQATVKDGFASADRVVAEVEWAGTQTGPLETPFGTIPATNQSGRTPGVVVARIEGGKIKAERVYFDVLGILRQLGVAPGMGQVPRAETPAGAQPRH